MLPSLHVEIVPIDNGAPGKLADAEVHFLDGPLTGMKLTGFAVWKRHNGAGYSVTLPSRSYPVGSERRSFALLRSRTDSVATDRVRAFVLAAYTAFLDGTRR